MKRGRGRTARYTTRASTVTRKSRRRKPSADIATENPNCETVQNTKRILRKRKNSDEIPTVDSKQQKRDTLKSHVSEKEGSSGAEDEESDLFQVRYSTISPLSSCMVHQRQGALEIRACVSHSKT